MFKPSVVFWAAILLFVPQHAFADNASSQKYKETLEALQKSDSICMDQAGTSADMSDCQTKFHNGLDTLLNESYRSLRNAVKEDKAYHEALRTEQLAWIKLNKAILDNVLQTGGGGSIDKITAASVSNQLLVNRIELFIYLHQDHHSDD